MSTSVESQYTLMLALMRAVQMAIRALDMSIGALILVLEAPVPDDAEPAPAPVSRASTGDDDDDVCDHLPMSERVNNAAMGHPNRFYCRKCKRNIE